MPQDKLISKSEIKEILKQNFPAFTNEDLRESIAAQSSVLAHSREEQIVRPGEYPKWIPLLLKGAIKVNRVDDSGQEIFLYYLYPGQTCALTLNCCMLEKPSEVRAVAEEGTQYLAVPRLKIAEWMNSYKDWRNFTLQSYDERYENLISTIDAIAFRKLDERLLELLKDKAIAMGTNELDITHKLLAEELHSSREVISRLLKQLEKLGKVKLSRNKIVLF